MAFEKKRMNNHLRSKGYVVLTVLESRAASFEHCDFLPYISSRSSFFPKYGPIALITSSSAMARRRPEGLLVAGGRGRSCAVLGILTTGGDGFECKVVFSLFHLVSQASHLADAAPSRGVGGGKERRRGGHRW